MLILHVCFSSPELMRHPDVNIDVKDLGPLLEQDVIRHLQNQYVRKKMSARSFLFSNVRKKLKDVTLECRRLTLVFHC